jgi:uncharacterized membrane-anchored protein
LEIDQQQNFRSFSSDDLNAALLEVHARPSIELEPNSSLTLFTFQADDDTCMLLAQKLGSGHLTSVPRFITGKIGATDIKLEKHTEFFSCTIIDPKPLETSTRDRLTELLESDNYFVLSHVSVSLHKNIASMLKKVSLGQRPVGGKLRGGLEVRTTLKIDDDGCQSFHVFTNAINKHELGRRIQRLLEMETYRVLCLLGLETARKSSGELTLLEDQLDKIIVQVDEGEHSSESSKTMLERLSAISSSLNSLRASMRYRISASIAYYDLVIQRLNSLQEEKSGDTQTLTGFVRSRLDPAISTIQSVDRRQRELSSEISNALSLLRTRIDVELNQANKASLQAMSKSHSQQLRISKTVEGLSIVAISYYAVGLIAYMLKSLIAEGWLNISFSVASGISVPIVVIAVALYLVRLRRHWLIED